MGVGGRGEFVGFGERKLTAHHPTCTFKANATFFNKACYASLGANFAGVSVSSVVSNSPSHC